MNPTSCNARDASRIAMARRTWPGVDAVLDAAALLSLDVFDTLVLRAVRRPADVFLHMADEARVRGWIPSDVTNESFSDERVAAECLARRDAEAGGREEISHEQIYQHWRWRPHTVAEWCALEVQIECRLAFANQAVLGLVALARARALPVVLVSDMYLPKAAIARIVEAATGDAGVADRIFVSSDGAGSKRSGSLFTHVSGALATPCGRIVHVGDNPYSDGQQASAAGCVTLRASLPDAYVSEIAAAEADGASRTFGPALTTLRSAVAAAHQPGDADRRVLEQLGAAVLGPLLTAYAEWVVTQCRAEDIRVVRTLTREGVLLEALVRRAARRQRTEIDVRHLPMSRSALWRCSHGALTDEAIAQLLDREQLTVADMCGLAGVAVPDDLLPYASDRVNGAATRRASGSSRDGLHQYLSATATRTRARQAFDDDRDAMEAYLAEAFGGARHVALVDVGFHGRVGRAIERAHGVGRHVSFTHLLGIGAASIARHQDEGSDVRAFVGGRDGSAVVTALVRHPALLEVLLVKGRSVRRIARERDGLVVHLNPTAISSRQAELVEACQTAVQQFQEAWCELANTHAALADAMLNDRAPLADIVFRLLDRPLPVEVASLSALTHELGEGGSVTEPLVPAARLPPSVTHGEFLAAALDGAPAFGRRWLWPQGVAAVRWPRETSEGHESSKTGMHRLAARLAGDGHHAVTVYGAGEAGRELVAALRQRHVAVERIVDRNSALWGTEVDRIPLMSLDEALAAGSRVFVIGSYAFASDIIAILDSRRPSTAEWNVYSIHVTGKAAA